MVPLSCGGSGQVIFGDRVIVGYDGGARLGKGEVRLQAATGVIIRVGARTHFSNNVQVLASAGVDIGADCLIGDAVLIMDADGHALAPELRHQSAGATDVVTIEDNVWIGSRAIILKGVTLGAGCVVGRRLSRHPFGAAAYGRGREPGTPYPHALIYHEPLLSS